MNTHQLFLLVTSQEFKDFYQGRIVAFANNSHEILRNQDYEFTRYGLLKEFRRMLKVFNKNNHVCADCGGSGQVLNDAELVDWCPACKGTGEQKAPDKIS